MDNLETKPLRAPLALVLVMALLQSLAASAGAQGGGKDEEARVLFQAAQMAFTDGRYEEALQYFERSYELSGRPTLLFNIGTTADRLRLEERALEAFRQFLVEQPETDNRREVEARIRILERAIEERAARAAVPSESEPDVAPQTAPPAGLELEPTASVDSPGADTGKTPVIKKWWFWTIIGVAVVGGLGVAAAAGGGGGGGGYQGERIAPPEPGSDGSVIYTLGFGR